MSITAPYIRVKGQSSKKVMAALVGVKRRRLQCPLCKETLSYSAFCRHQQTQNCITSNRHFSISESENSDDVDSNVLPEVNECCEVLPKDNECSVDVFLKIMI